MARTTRTLLPRLLLLRRMHSRSECSTFTTRTLLLLLALGGMAGTVGAGNWARFRGPNGTGAVADKDVPLTFGAKENVRWRVDLPGTGNSSPVVWGQRLFLQAASADGKQRTLLCLDTANGKTLWERTIPGVFVKIREDSSFASSTPTTDGKAVYVMFWDGKTVIASAFDFQGGPLWSKDLGPFISQHGVAASPILYKDMLIFANDMDRLDPVTKQPVPVEHPALLLALDKKTGKVIWEAPRPAERACYSAPFLRQQPGQAEPELVVLSTTAITGYNVATGAVVWETRDWQADFFKAGRNRTVAVPVLAGDVLLACCGGDNGRLAVAFELPRGGATGTPKRLWSSRKDFPYVPGPLAHGDHFYMVNDDGNAGCYEARTGKRVWYERLAATRFTATPVLIDGKIYAASEAGDVFVFAAAPKFELLAQNSLGERIRATPAVADGCLYVRGARSLFCVGKAGGTK